MSTLRARLREALRRPVTIMVIPEDGGESRSIRLSAFRLRLLAGVAALVIMALVLMAGSWWFVARQAARVPGLEARASAAEAEAARVRTLALRLQDVEERYRRLRSLFGSSPAAEGSDIWLPPPPGGTGGETPLPPPGPSIPSSWPLPERGVITQHLLEGAEGDHPGLDVAVPTHTYILAAGGGTVVDLGEDDIYGKFVILDHGDGYSTLYAHASLLLVERGQEVREREVIALTGSTGRSTAPHLHFEVLKDGAPVDPLTLVAQPPA